MSRPVSRSLAVGAVVAGLVFAATPLAVSQVTSSLGGGQPGTSTSFTTGGAAPTAAGAKVYYSDSNSYGPTTPFFEYDVASDVWTPRADIPHPNTTQLAADETGTVYALPEDGNVYRYDPGGDAWVLVMVGPAAAVGRNNISFFEANGGEFYWGRDATTTLYYTSGGTWNSIGTPRTISSGADVDRATGILYIRTYSQLGFFAFDPASLTFPKTD